MAMLNKTKNIFEGLIKEGSFKWPLSRTTSFDEEFDELGRSPTGKRKSIPELSRIANIIVARCSKILDISMDELQHNFSKVASDTIKNPSNYARNFLEYCCFNALTQSTQVTRNLSDLEFRRLTFDMMLAWESPSVESSYKVTRDSTVGVEAFSRIAPAIPIIADVVTSSNIFDVLTNSTGGRLTFTVYEKYIGGLDKAIKKMKNQTESSLLSGFRSQRVERILEVDGTLTTQPVLEHVGISTWPGRLILTDHALYFEALKVVTYDKAKVYDLADDLKQVIRPELTGPWGSRLFDKAVMYKSASLAEPLIVEFPELTGHSRRDYWLAIMREILYAHRFIRKFHMEGVEKEETLSKAVLGILRLQAIQDLLSSLPVRCESLLMFNLADQLPGGDVILETFANMIVSRRVNHDSHSISSSGMHSLSAMKILSNLGVVSHGSDEKLLVGEIIVGEMNSLEKVVSESKNNYKMVEKAQATVDGVKVDGLDTNLAVMKELLYPFTELGKKIMFLASWEDPIKSMLFCSISSFIILRRLGRLAARRFAQARLDKVYCLKGWIGYIFVGALLFVAIFMLLTRYCNMGRPIDQVKVMAPPPMNTMEQLLAVQNAISQVEQLVQDGNIVLLKIRALLLAVPSQATNSAILALLFMALATSYIPMKYLFLLTFLELFTRYSPLRRQSTEKWTRRLREWWFSIPAAPVILDRENKDDKKRR